MNRYIRNLQLAGFSEGTQRLLQQSTVSIVGAGALGSVVAMYLAAAGIGRIKIADFDTVDITNLQRQIFFKETEAGQMKAEILRDRINGLNSEVNVELFPALATPKNCDTLFADADVIAECSDNPATKALSVDFGITHNIPVVLGGVNEFEGQVAVFNHSRRYTDIFPSPACNIALPCSQKGVFSPLPGIVASFQASEIIKTVGKLQGALCNQLLTFDLRSMTFHTFSF